MLKPDIVDIFFWPGQMEMTALSPGSDLIEEVFQP